MTGRYARGPLPVVVVVSLEAMNLSSYVGHRPPQFTHTGLSDSDTHHSGPLRHLLTWQRVRLTTL